MHGLVTTPIYTHTHTEPHPLVLFSYTDGIGSFNTFTRTAAPNVLSRDVHVFDYHYEEGVSL